MTECFKIFDLIHRTVDSLDKVKRLTQEVLEDFRDDGCVYLELRSTPRDRAGAWTKRTYLDVVVAVLTEWNASSEGLRMCVRFLLSIDRTTCLEEAMEVVDLACEYKEHTHNMVVGLDFCGRCPKRCARAP
jgi:adenosine deaminase